LIHTHAQIPVAYPTSAFEIEIPELEGKTAKMYRGGKICLTAHFKPLWARNVPSFGIAHALAMGVSSLSPCLQSRHETHQTNDQPQRSNGWNDPNSSRLGWPQRFLIWCKRVSSDTTKILAFHLPQSPPHHHPLLLLLRLPLLIPRARNKRGLLFSFTNRPTTSDGSTERKKERRDETKRQKRGEKTQRER